jgi:hypothetical protein
MQMLPKCVDRAHARVRASCGLVGGWRGLVAGVQLFMCMCARAGDMHCRGGFAMLGAAYVRGQCLMRVFEPLARPSYGLVSR